MKLTLREWRRIKEISQESMAKLCGIHVNTYRIWEENPAEIKLSCAYKIVERLGITLDDIVMEPTLQKVIKQEGDRHDTSTSGETAPVI